MAAADTPPKMLRRQAEYWAQRSGAERLAFALRLTAYAHELTGPGSATAILA